MITDYQGYKIDIKSFNTVIVGTGAAGYNAAIRLRQFGVNSVCIVTEGVNMGTSRNTGSDKQTYYKLGMSGGDCDSPLDMAKDLFAGMLTDGDNALCEAALSPRCFLNLCELGVEFPTNRYGEYVGYKTDHDPHARATSVGPLTSKMMTYALEKKAKELQITVFDRYLAVSVIKDDSDEACGLICLNMNELNDKSKVLTVFKCKNIVWATGGPAGMYADSVYPECHTGSSGVAFEAGVLGKNLTEWQYGLASVNPRWNVSGTYMQVLPRFVSVDNDGTEHEFLADFFTDEYEALSMVFLKGYQWPFDCRKVLDGSSVIDLLVYKERAVKGRRVFLDFRSNPFGKEKLEFDRLSPAARDYLEKANACFGTPIERLKLMNSPAIDLYAEKGVDLNTEMLEISLCAQHNNGGLSVDMWWQTGIKGLFAAGEVAGTHGVYRPGGSALNSGQVGSLRCAMYISENRNGEPVNEQEFIPCAKKYSDKVIRIINSLLDKENNTSALINNARRRMSFCGGAIRDKDKINKAVSETKNDLDNFETAVGAGGIFGLADAFRLRDMLISQYVYLSAMGEYFTSSGCSRGSFICCDKSGALRQGLDEQFRFTPFDEAAELPEIQEVAYFNGQCSFSHRKPRAIPEAGGFFENVWRDYRKNKNVY